MRGNEDGELPFPSVPKDDRIRERLVTVAVDLIRDHGPDAVDLAAVAAAAGVDVAVLRRCFADMPALVEAVVAHQLGVVLAVQAPVLARVTSLDDLDLWRDAVLAGADGGVPACPLGSLVGTFGKGHGSGRSSLLTAFGQWESRISGALSRLQTNGELATDAEPTTLAIGLVAAVQGGLLLARTTRDQSKLRSALDMALHHIRSYGTAPSAPDAATDRSDDIPGLSRP